MNFFRTMLLLAAMTALFMGVGYLIGGTGGMMIAFLFAVGTNAFAYWNSDKMVLRMHNAEPVTRASAPELHDMVARLADQVDLGHRQAGALRQPRDHVVELGGAGPGHRLGMVHAQHHLVRVPVGEGVGADREQQGDHHAAGAAEQVADAHEQRGHRRQQQHRPEEVHGVRPPCRAGPRAYDRTAEPRGNICPSVTRRKRRASPPPQRAPWARPRRGTPPPRRPACRPSGVAATAPSRSASATGSAAASPSTSEGHPREETGSVEGAGQPAESVNNG